MSDETDSDIQCEEVYVDEPQDETQICYYCGQPICFLCGCCGNKECENCNCPEAS